MRRSSADFLRKAFQALDRLDVYKAAVARTITLLAGSYRMNKKEEIKKRRRK